MILRPIPDPKGVTIKRGSRRSRGNIEVKGHKGGSRQKGVDKGNRLGLSDRRGHGTRQGNIYPFVKKKTDTLLGGGGDGTKIN